MNPDNPETTDESSDDHPETIAAVHDRLDELEAENEALREENETIREQLETENEALRERLEAFESLFAEITAPSRVPGLDAPGRAETDDGIVAFDGSNETYKILGQIDDSNNGIGVLGCNVASSGTTYGVKGEVDSTDGYGLYTPDNARVDGELETTALNGGLTGSVSLTDLAGNNLGIFSGSLGTTDPFQVDALTDNGSGNIELGDDLNLNANSLVDNAAGQTIWDNSSAHIPTSALESDEVTVSPGNALSSPESGQVTLGNTTTLNVESSGVGTNELDTPFTDLTSLFGDPATTGGALEVSDKIQQNAMTRVDLGNDTQDVSAGSWTIVKLDSVEIDEPGAWSTSNYKYTCPKAGHYRVTFSPSWSSPSTESRLGSRIVLDGTRISEWDETVAAGADLDPTYTTTVTNVQSGDKIWAEVEHNDSDSITLTFSSWATHLEIRYLGDGI